jgi:formiminotetrahydrofolate cyclodeaminase
MAAVPTNAQPADPPSGLGSVQIAQFLADLAAKSPAPGGGAAACLAGAVASAQASMVVAYSIGRKSLSEHQLVLEAAAARLARARSMFLDLADADAEAYAALSAVQKLPLGHPLRETEHRLLDAAIAAPRAAQALAAEVLRLMEELVGRSNPNLRSDLAVAAALAEAAGAASGWNVRINTPGLGDPAARAAIEGDSARLAAEARARRERVEAACAAGW